MALTVEDGSVVANADSYWTLVDAQTFLTGVGLTDTAIDDAAMVRAYYYLTSLEQRYQGSRVSADQTGSFPRYNVSINGFAFSSGSIPDQLKQAQAYIAFYEVETPGVTQPNGNGAQVTHEEISGAVAIDYADNGISSDSFNIPAVNALVDQLFKTTNTALSVLRV